MSDLEKNRYLPVKDQSSKGQRNGSYFRESCKGPSCLKNPSPYISRMSLIIVISTFSIARICCLETSKMLSSLVIDYCAGGKIEKNGMGGTCGAYGGGERCAQGSGGET